jgi:hypothetical protein
MSAEKSREKFPTGMPAPSNGAAELASAGSIAARSRERALTAFDGAADSPAQQQLRAGLTGLGATGALWPQQLRAGAAFSSDPVAGA